MTTADISVTCLVFIPFLGWVAGLFWAKPFPPPKPGHLFPEDLRAWEQEKRRSDVRMRTVSILAFTPMIVWIVLRLM